MGKQLNPWDLPEVRNRLKEIRDHDAMIARNAKPFKGRERVAGRNSWLARVQEDGFASFTCKREGGSTTPAPATNWDRERLGVLRGTCFPGQGSFSRFLGNLRRHLGGIPTVSECLQAVEAFQSGSPWRALLPAGLAKARDLQTVTVEGITFALLDPWQGPVEYEPRSQVRDWVPINPVASKGRGEGWILADVSSWFAFCYRRFVTKEYQGGSLSVQASKWFRVLGIPQNGASVASVGSLLGSW